MSTENPIRSNDAARLAALAPMLAACDACSNAETGFSELATMLEAIIAAAGKASKAGRLAAIAYNLADESRIVMRGHSDELEAGLKALRDGGQP
jgi:hypothetical protein